MHISPALLCKDTCWSVLDGKLYPNTTPQYLWIWPYLENRSSQIKLRTLKWDYPELTKWFSPLLGGLNSGPHTCCAVLLEPLPLPYFCVCYFWDRVSLYAPTSPDHNMLICASLLSWDDRCMPSYPVIGWDGVSWSLIPSWPWIVILQLSLFK
jgi:hypothetical protein